jgi:unsaturated chondroitin disaccharide hydrolase
MTRTVVSGACRLLTAGIFLACLIAAPGRPRADPIDLARIDSALAQARARITLQTLAGNTSAFPRAHGETGHWNTVGPRDWTAGFFPGELWLLYEATGQQSWRDAATAWTLPLASQAARIDTHDLGFMIGLSFGNFQRLTDDPRPRPVLLRAATSLARRYSPATHAMRTFEGQRWSYAVIVDSMMNLAPWLWGAIHGGNPAWREMAVAHGRTVLAQVMRKDGGSHHLADLNARTGSLIRQETYQGYANGSVWSRGQAWAMHGFAALYEATGEPEFLAAAMRASDYFLAHLPPDRVPSWDFDAPQTAATPRDTSAGAIAASALEMLCTAAPAPDNARYCQAGLILLGALAAKPYLAPTGSAALLQHGTGPDSEIDTALIYGDYYFVEALLRARAILGPVGRMQSAAPSIP